MNTRRHPWIQGVTLAALAATAMAAELAEGARLSSGAADTAYQAHPILTGIVHGLFIILVVSLSAIILSSLVNPRSFR